MHEVFDRGVDWLYSLYLLVCPRSWLLSALARWHASAMKAFAERDMPMFDAALAKKLIVCRAMRRRGFTRQRA